MRTEYDGKILRNGKEIDIKYCWVSSEDIRYCIDGKCYYTHYKSLIV
jgi:hypothetical protein